MPAAGFLKVKLCCLSTGRGAVVTEAVFSSEVSIGDWWPMERGSEKDYKTGGDVFQ